MSKLKCIHLFQCNNRQDPDGRESGSSGSMGEAPKDNEGLYLSVINKAYEGDIHIKTSGEEMDMKMEITVEAKV